MCRPILKDIYVYGSIVDVEPLTNCRADAHRYSDVHEIYSETVRIDSRKHRSASFTGDFYYSTKE